MLLCLVFESSNGRGYDAEVSEIPDVILSDGALSVELRNRIITTGQRRLVLTLMREC